MFELVFSLDSYNDYFSSIREYSPEVTADWHEFKASLLMNQPRQGWLHCLLDKAECERIIGVIPDKDETETKD